MRSVMNAQQMRDVDKYMIDTLHIPGIVLMENAALGAARLIMDKAEPGSAVHVFCGAGNNGGDGLACARILLAHDYDAYVVLVGEPDRLPADAAANYEMFRRFESRVLQLRRIEDLYSWRVPKADVIVDALFGTGLSRDVSGVYEEVIEVLNKSSAIKVAVDIPSGISADNGRVLGCAVKADYTVTFQYPKMGHYLFPGRQYAGELTVVPIGYDEGLEAVVDSTVTVVESGDPDMALVARPQDSNKGTYGKLFLIAGSRGMAGAAVMSAKAAYAAGAGLVNVGAPKDVIDVMQISEPEATCTILPDENGMLYGGSRVEIAKAMYKKSALAIGPGIGDAEGVKDIVTDIVDDDSLCRVVDADALNALAGDLHILAHMKGDLIFTPHPLEFARLINTEVDGVLEHPVELATAFAKRCGIVLVLKGATTIIADKDGSVTLVAAGTPGMAKGGSGDVLTGVIGGLAAQGFSAKDAAVLGVYYCAMAGERAAEARGVYSMTPADTIAELGAAIGATSSGPDAWRPARTPNSAYTPLARPVMRETRSRQITPPPVSPPPAFELPEETSGHEAIQEAAPVEIPAASEPEYVEEEYVEEVFEEPAPEPERAAVRSVEAEEKIVRTEARPSDRLRAPQRTENHSARSVAKTAESAAETQPEETRRSVGSPEPARQRPLSRAEAARREADSANEMANEVANRLRGTTRDTGKIAEEVASAQNPSEKPASRSAAEKPAASQRAAQPHSASQKAASQRVAQSQTSAQKPVSQHTSSQTAAPQHTSSQSAVSQHTSTRIVPAAPLSHETPSATRSERRSASSTRSDAQKKRDDLNAQIQNELSKQGKDKPVTRTRRRIG